MRTWFSHGWLVGGIGMLSFAGLVLLGQALGLELPVWLPICIPLIFIASVPLGSALRRREGRALARALLARRAHAFVAVADIDVRGLMRLIVPVAPGRGTTLGARNQFGITVTRSVENLVAVFTETALEFWTGPISHPRHLTSAALGDVAVDLTTGRFTVRVGDVSVDFSLSSGSGRGRLSGDQLERMLRAATRPSGRVL